MPRVVSSQSTDRFVKKDKTERQTSHDEKSGAEGRHSPSYSSEQGQRGAERVRLGLAVECGAS